MSLAINIPELSPGSVAVVVGYSRIYGGYVGQLVTHGLVPGVFFVVLNVDLPQGCVQIMLNDKILILSKPQVNALFIEGLSRED